MERPWDLARTNPKRLEELIHGLLEALSDVSSLLEPFMPETSRKIVDQLKTGKIEPLFPRKK
jgi:methionyl-tRNA synthetase